MFELWIGDEVAETQIIDDHGDGDDCVAVLISFLIEYLGSVDQLVSSTQPVAFNVELTVWPAQVLS